MLAHRQQDGRSNVQKAQQVTRDPRVLTGDAVDALERGERACGDVAEIAQRRGDYIQSGRNFYWLGHTPCADFVAIIANALEFVRECKATGSRCRFFSGGCRVRSFPADVRADARANSAQCSNRATDPHCSASGVRAAEPAVRLTHRAAVAARECLAAASRGQRS